MQLLRHGLLFSLLALCFSCKKESSPQQPKPEPISEKVKRQHGQPSGTAVRTTITGSGGTVVSIDGRLTLTIPAGAVETATEFSVQPITNTLKTRGLAYRLLPEGVTFKKEIAITYSYAGLPLLNADSKYLFLAYQDADGYYHEARRTQNNKAAQTLTVQTKHFSDWTFFSRVELETNWTLVNGVAYMKKNDELHLAITVYRAPEAGGDAEPLLYSYELDADITGSQWTLTKQKGTLTDLDPYLMADYKAPATIPQREGLAIHVALTGSLGVDNNGGHVSQLIVGQEVVLEPEDDEYFYLSVEGSEFSLTKLTAEYIPGWISIGGYTAADHPIALYIFASGTGTFSHGQPGEANKVNMEYTHSPTETFISYKPVNCSVGSGLSLASGGVRLTKIAQAVGEYTEGDFTGGLYRTAYCNNPGSKNVSGRFKIKKRQ